MLPFAEVANYEFHSVNLWAVKITGNWGALTNGFVPATDVSFQSIEPLYDETEIGPGLKVQILKGYNGTQTIMVGVAENDALLMRKTYENVITSLGNEPNLMVGRRGINLMVSQAPLELELQEFSSGLELIQHYKFSVIPKEALDIQLGSSSDALEYKLSFAVIGANAPLRS